MVPGTSNLRFLGYGYQCIAAGKLRTSWGAQTLPVVMTNCYTIGVGRAGQGIFEFYMSDSRVGGGQVEGRVLKPWASPSVIYSGWSAPAR